MKLISQEFIPGEDNLGTNTREFSELDKEKLKIIFGIAQTLEPQALFSMALTYLSMIVENMIGDDCAIDFCNKTMAFIDEYALEHYNGKVPKDWRKQD